MDKEKVNELLMEFDYFLETFSERFKGLARKVSILTDDEEAPDSEFDVGDILDIANVNSHSGTLEFLTGTVTEIKLKDEDGWFNRVVTPDGRKFKIPMNSEDTRKGTRVSGRHDR